MGTGTQSIRIDSREQFGQMLEFAREYMPSTVARMSHYSGERPIFDLFNIDEELVREVEAQLLVQQATEHFFDFMEKRFQPDVRGARKDGPRDGGNAAFEGRGLLPR